MDKLRIVHLEDDPVDADLVRRAVARIDQRPVWLDATSVDRFLELVATEPFDAVISDGSVPGIEGLEALKLAREKQPGIPFVFVSGNADPRWAEHCIEAGATDYVPKDELWRLPSALGRLDAALQARRMAWLTGARGSLVDIVKRLSLARSVEAIVEIVRTSSRALLRCDGTTFVLRDGDLCHYVDEDAIAPLWKGSRFPMSACISGWAMLNGRAAVVPDIYADARIPHDAYRPTFVKSLAMVPIRAEAPIGAIGSYWASRHEATADEVEIAQALADATSLAFENVALYASLEQRVQQRTVELQEAVKEHAAFAYSVSHDLRAPLRAVQGYSDLLADDVDPPLQGRAATYLQQIRRSAKRMNTLIDDMLMLSKITRADVRRRPVPLGAMVRGLLAGWQSQEPHRRVRLDIDADAVAQADESLLRLALENLVSNAWKYTSKREVAHIEFFATPGADGGPTVYCLRDNGAGFDMAHARHLFEPFRRLHTESDFPGTGVGLAIVRRVMHKHGGDVWAEAERDKGASFRFTLPPPGDA